MHCREIMFTPHCSSRAREFSRSGQLFCTTYGCGATVPFIKIMIMSVISNDNVLFVYRTVQIAQFPILAYFSIQNP